MKKFPSVILFLFVVIGSVCAARVDTVSIQSQSMTGAIKCVVITPGSYNKEKTEFPVVYLLHGYGGNYSSWIKKAPHVAALSDLYRVIIICPDGGFDSWYWDSPIEKNSRYETHIIREVIPFVDKNYRTVKNRRGRAISGLSMGGQGALYLAFKHQDLFGACGSQSGGVDISPFPNRWGMAAKIGKLADQPEVWEKQTVFNMVHLLIPGSLKIAIDCGLDDFFYSVNQSLHKKLDYYNIPHDYTIRPGKHNWEYWRNSVKYQLLFFYEYFQENKTK